jgi:hypothetical protein
MLSSDYLIKGITGLSRASQGSPMEGHYGPTVIAAYYFCRENDLDKKTEKAVQKQIDQLISKFEPFFISLPAEDPEPGAISHIIQPLDVNVHELRAIGHNVIFSTLAIKALHDPPSLEIPLTIKKICTLIEGFDQASRGGPFPGWPSSEISTTAVNPEDQFPAYDDEEAIIHFTFDALLKIKTICTGKHEGTIGHLLTHADALNELSRLGYPVSAKKGYLSHQIYVKLATRSFVPDEWGGGYPGRTRLKMIYLLARFRREAKAAGSLQHNNIARIHALEDDGDTHFMVSDRADTRLMKHKPLYCHGGN